MLDHPELWLVAGAIAAGGFVQSASGFGLALVAVPLTTGLLGLQQSAPTMNLLGTMLCAIVLYYNWGGVLWAEVARMLIASVPGIFLGVAVLRFGDSELITRGLGWFVLSYAIYALVSENLLPEATGRPLRHPLLGVLAGFLGGFFGGASALNGPPVVLYGAYQRWPKERFKGTLQSYFLFNNLFISLTHLATGSLTPGVLKWAAIGVPALLAGSTVGHLLSRHLHPLWFRRCVLVLIFLVGASLAWR